MLFIKLSAGFLHFASLDTLSALSRLGQSIYGVPSPPKPEAIEISRLPLPPVISNIHKGACTNKINPHQTGCIGRTTGLQAGSFLPDGNHVLATVRFAGAPATPNPASIYDGQQLITVKIDGTLFPNGDPWKCVTCGVPAENRAGVTTAMDYAYPQAFADGKRVLVGSYIVDCGENTVTSMECVPQKVFIYPIRFENSTDGSGPGGTIRETRLHPDNIHLGFNSFSYSSGQLSQDTYIGRLDFNPSPTKGTPRSPRYDLLKVNRLINPNAMSPITVKGKKLHINKDAITVGELRGFSGTGKEVTYIGYPRESCNIDVFAADLTTGKVRRVTTHSGYVDPVQMSPDDKWIVIMDTRGSGRTEFMDGVRGIPPITDMITTAACASIRNNGARRFFQPYLLDRYGDRGNYYGQKINGDGAGIPGSGAINDPEWNGMADPWFSPDGTRIVYAQAQTVAPACGGDNPLPCYNSSEPGGRRERLMLAHMTSRKPLQPRKVPPPLKTIPWAVPYVPGISNLTFSYPREGKYTLKGHYHGSAAVKIIENSSKTAIQTVEVRYNNFSDDGAETITGTQNVTVTVKALTENHLDWFSDLVRTGRSKSKQITSPGGFHMSIDAMKNIFEANGTLTTTVDGVVYKQPLNGA